MQIIIKKCLTHTNELRPLLEDLAKPKSLREGGVPDKGSVGLVKPPPMFLHNLYPIKYHDIQPKNEEKICENFYIFFTVHIKHDVIEDK